MTQRDVPQWVIWTGYVIAIMAVLGGLYLSLTVDTTRDKPNTICSENFASNDWTSAKYVNSTRPYVLCVNETGTYLHFCRNGCGAELY